MSSVVQAPKYYVFIAGRPVQFESITINSGYNQLASLNLTLHFYNKIGLFLNCMINLYNNVFFIKKKY